MNTNDRLIHRTNSYDVLLKQKYNIQNQLNTIKKSDVRKTIRNKKKYERLYNKLSNIKSRNAIIKPDEKRRRGSKYTSFNSRKRISKHKKHKRKHARLQSQNSIFKQQPLILYKTINTSKTV